MIRPLLTAPCLLFFLHAAYAFDLNDCIINGMKGVSSDVAARQVRYACDQKQKEHEQRQSDRVKTEFGERIDEGSLEEAKYFAQEEAGFHSMQYTNKTKDKTVTYIRLNVYPSEGGFCDFKKLRTFAYKVTLKPNDIIKLIYPTTTTLGNCLEPGLVLARTPSSWKDVSFSSTARPASPDPLGQ